MNNTIQTLELIFKGVDGLEHIFRITNLLSPIDVNKVNQALDDIPQTGAFANESGTYYAVPVRADVITTKTETIATR